MICNLKHVMTSWYTVARGRKYIYIYICGATLPFDAKKLAVKLEFQFHIWCPVWNLQKKSNFMSSIIQSP